MSDLKNIQGIFIKNSESSEEDFTEYTEDYYQGSSEDDYQGSSEDDFEENIEEKHMITYCDPINNDDAKEMASTIRYILYGFDYCPQKRKYRSIKPRNISKLYISKSSVLTEYESDNTVLLLRKMVEDKIKIALLQIEKYYKSVLEKRADIINFIGLIRILVVIDRISLPKEILIKCLTATALYINSHEKEYPEDKYLSRQKDNDRDSNEYNEFHKLLIKWLQKEFNDNYTPKLFMLLVQLKDSNKEDLPSIEDYNKLQNMK